MSNFFETGTTPRDYSKFLLAMFSSNNEKRNLLSKEWIDRMLSTQIHVTNDLPPYDINWPKEKVVENKDVSWGLGWGLQTNEDGSFFWHWGDNDVYKAITPVSNEKKSGLTLMSNSNSGSKIWSEILSLLFGKNLPVIQYLNVCHPGYL